MSSDRARSAAFRSEALWSGIIRWRGVVLIGVAIVVTIWLGATNQLILYINPNYLVFTLIMAVIALGLLISSLIVRAVHAHEDAAPTLSQKVLTILGALIALVLATAMVVIPPATLSSATAIQRDVSASTVASTNQTASVAKSAANSTYARFSVLDWSTLLRQTGDPGFYAGKPANVIGFVTPDSDDPADLFYLTRFVITCCAVDAQPVAVPVYDPDWKSQFGANAWVQVVGGFLTNPITKSSAQIALVPSKVTTVAKPSQPYLF